MKRCGRLLGLSGIDPSIRVRFRHKRAFAGLMPGNIQLGDQRLSVPDRLESKQRLHDLSP